MGNIVLMNFIIAVVSESYEACMTKRVAQTYKVKVDMIVERENLMSEELFLKRSFFPKYILVRQPRDGDQAHEIELERRREEMEKEIKMIWEAVEQLKSDIKPETINKLVMEEVQKVKIETSKIDDVMS